MKDLISIFNYSPDNRRKEILHSLLIKLQPLRDKFDLLVVSHSSIPDISLGMVDFFFYDRNNELLTDFDLTNKFWFRSPEMAINSSLVYPFSTHLAIYSLLYYTFDFAFHRDYKKIHLIEFDIELKDLNLILDVNEDLETNDVVMFKGSDEWILGVYFASTLNGFTKEKFKYDKQKILQQLIESDSRMTERVTPVILCKDRKVKLREFVEINEGKNCQLNDEHGNTNLNWVVPVVLKNTNELNFFIYNENGTNHVVDLFINNKHTFFEVNQGAGIWNLTSIGDIDGIDEILIYVDKELVKKVILNSTNRKKFKDNNFLVYFNDEN